VNGKGARFTGGYVEVNHNDILNLDKGYTFSVWIYKEYTREQLTQPILTKTEVADKPNDNAYYFYNEQDRPGVSAWLNGSSKSSTSTKWIDVEKWSLCTITADENNIRYYIDGKLVDNVAKKIAFPKSTGKLNIGYRSTAFGHLQKFRMNLIILLMALEKIL
jgi:hypothetical protein